MLDSCDYFGSVVADEDCFVILFGEGTWGAEKKVWSFTLNLDVLYISVKSI